jgi:hypothetical protein
MSEDHGNLDELIVMEREVMAELKKMFSDPALSTLDRVRVANALAYHAVVLNRLQSKKGEDSLFDEDNLGDFVAGAHYANGPMRRRIRRDFRDWTRRISLKK